MMGKLNANINKFECELCKEKHCIPEKGFAINRRIQNGLDIKLNSLKLNSVYEECKKKINEAKYQIQKIEILEKNPENYVFEYFEELKRQVDLREELKLKLDNCSDDIIKTIESAKDNCIKFFKESKRLGTEIEKSKEELTNLTGRFDTFDFNELKFETIKHSLSILNGDLTRKLSDYKYSIIGGKNYTFEVKDIDIKCLFGYFKEVENVILHLIYP